MRHKPKRYSQAGLLTATAALLLVVSACSTEVDEMADVNTSVAVTVPGSGEDSSSDLSSGTSTSEPDDAASDEFDRGLGVPSWLLDELQPCGNAGIGIVCGETPADDGHMVRFAFLPARVEPVAGLLVAHFGGPGTDARAFLPGWSILAPGEERVLGRFDLLAVEQRGTDRVDGVDCGNDAALHRLLTGTVPAGEQDALLKEWISGCPAGKFGSAVAASDIAAALRHLSPERAVFAGFSYGGVIGVLLGSNHADAVDAIVLDSPSLGWRNPRAGVLQVRSASRALQAFFDNCDRTRSCRFAPDGNSVDRYRSLVDSYDALGDLTYATVVLLYSETSAPQLDAMLHSALGGDTSEVTRYADIYHRRRGGIYQPSSEVFPLVTCADGITEPLEDLAVSLAELRSFGVLGELAADGLFVSSDQCQHWAGEADPFEMNLSSSAVPTLVVASTNDPAIPWEVVEPFIESSLPAESATLLLDSFDHTFWRGGNACVDEAVEEFILDDTLPPQSVVDCGG